MPFTPGPYSGVSTLALVARASALGVGVVYGAVKLSILKPRNGRLIQDTIRNLKQKPLGRSFAWIAVTNQRTACFQTTIDQITD
uniref:ATP synthase subunit e, mitochondrial n=1 Tax=Oryza barthii TaxID=65489 RepID=A0A0D3FS06_9ORYZ